jgi:hypothetical protein
VGGLLLQQCGGILSPSICDPASASHILSVEPTGQEQKTKPV